MTAEEAISTGRRAKEILEDAVFVRALADIEAECLAEIRGSKHDEKDRREAAYVRLKAVDAVRDKLRVLSSRGEFAKARGDRNT
ncbi:hypothetical protein [Azospirillum sp. ST 5-10]|uniref:hypothetical protein n=1 Tax=unclassified Azospirillum TaxID=2630922 RepID=UPI003F49B942